MWQYPGVDNIIRSLIPASKTSYLNLLDRPLSGHLLSISNTNTTSHPPTYMQLRPHRRPSPHSLNSSSHQQSINFQNMYSRNHPRPNSSNIHSQSSSKTTLSDSSSKMTSSASPTSVSFTPSTPPNATLPRWPTPPRLSRPPSGSQPSSPSSINSASPSSDRSPTRDNNSHGVDEVGTDWNTTSSQWNSDPAAVAPVVIRARRTPYYPPNASRNIDHTRVYTSRGPHYLPNWTPR
jgi:hypothetical protein